MSAKKKKKTYFSSFGLFDADSTHCILLLVVTWVAVAVLFDDRGKLRWIPLVSRMRKPIRIYNRTRIPMGNMKKRKDDNS
jgi:hypothetical protein